MKPFELLDKIEVADDELYKIKNWIGLNQDKFKIAEPILKEGLIVNKETTEKKDTVVTIYFRVVSLTEIQFKIYWGEHLVISYVARNYMNLVSSLFGTVPQTNNLTWSATDLVLSEHAKHLQIKGNIHGQDPWQLLQNNTMRTYLYIIAYTQFFREYVTSSERKVTLNKSNKSNKKNKSNHKVRMTKVYLLNVPDKETLDKRPYVRHTDSWGVRGHWRTYKNGKSVFVKAYNKGNKDNVVGKTYKI